MRRKKKNYEKSEELNAEAHMVVTGSVSRNANAWYVDRRATAAVIMVMMVTRGKTSMLIHSRTQRL